MGRFGVELLLIAFAAIVVTGFIVTYTISVALDHVTPYLPYISDTGGKPPESCIFSFVCNVAILFELLIVFIRYRHIHAHYIEGVRTLLCPMKFLNVSSFVAGLLSTFGFLLVANFQNDSVPSVHFIGAFVVFFAGLVYQWIQAYITFWIYRSGMARHLSVRWVIMQFIICIMALVFFIGAIVFGVLAVKSLEDKENESGTFFWTPKDGGFAFHVVSTASEWGAGLSLLLFFLTFHPDFKQIRLDIRVRGRSEFTSESFQTAVNESTPLTI